MLENAYTGVKRMKFIILFITTWQIFGNFLRPAFQASRVQHISDLHSKFVLGPHQYRSMVDIQSTIDEISRAAVNE